MVLISLKLITLPLQRAVSAPTGEESICAPGGGVSHGGGVAIYRPPRSTAAGGGPAVCGRELLLVFLKLNLWGHMQAWSRMCFWHVLPCPFSGGEHPSNSTALGKALKG